MFAHQNADPDAIASVIGLKHILKQFFPKVKFTLFAQSINTISKKLLATGNEVFQSDTVPNNLDIIFICDANNIQQLGNISLNNFTSLKKPIIIIDHHEKIEQSDEITHAIINAETSTAEMIGKIYEKLEIALDPKIATFLLAGILFDTRRFIYRTESTFDTVQFLINSGGNYDEALSILQKEPSNSEKIARLKGVTRTVIHREGTYIYAFTHVSSYESSLARGLIGLGASFAVVLAVPSDNEYRISMRCTKTFAEGNNISLGTLANVISAKFEGSGGGHQTAAGINFSKPKEFPKSKDEIVQMLLKMILKEVKMK
ncbi:MAG: DHH family phosphoesterase [Candidatus Heimdallarchaeaceae archaeon]